jgi:hypothetical protein
MKKIRWVVSVLCMVVVLALAVPASVNAEDGPQGGSNSTKNAPPPPPPSTGSGMLGVLIAYLLT